jgi:hypothetical protein
MAEMAVVDSRSMADKFLRNSGDLEGSTSLLWRFLAAVVDAEAAEVATDAILAAAAATAGLAPWAGTEGVALEAEDEISLFSTCLLAGVLNITQPELINYKDK